MLPLTIYLSSLSFPHPIHSILFIQPPPKTLNFPSLTHLDMIQPINLTCLPLLNQPTNPSLA